MPDPADTSIIDTFQILENGALVAITALIGDGVEISAGVTIEDGAVIGDFCKIGFHSHIGDSVELGQGVQIGHHTVIDHESELGPGVKVGDFVRIGPYNILLPGAVIINCCTVVGESLGGSGSSAEDGLLARVAEAGRCYSVITDQPDGLYSLSDHLAQAPAAD